jgi:hypothetical protein
MKLPIITALGGSVNSVRVVQHGVPQHESLQAMARNALPGVIIPVDYRTQIRKS